MEMASAKEIEKELKIALDEIGQITPWFDKEVNEWVFSHELYPVEYGGATLEEVIEKYPFYLKEFIKERLIGNLSPRIEIKTKGKGGYRPGSGRPKGSTKEQKERIYLPVDIAEWFKKYPLAYHDVRQLMQKRTA
jgi:hypothetical protein